MRTKATILNSFSGILYYLINVLLNIISRRAIIFFLGIEYQGVNGLFSNILSMLSIAELGFGTAIIYHLYEPIKVNDQEKIIALLQFYKKTYNIIAAVIFLLGICLTPFVHLFVDTSTLNIHFKLVFLLFLMDSVLSYCFTYKRSLLIADQKNYIVTYFDIVYILLSTLAQIAILNLTRNFYYFLTVKFLFRLLENLILNIWINHHYKYITRKETILLDSEIFRDIILKVKGLMFHRIGSFVVTGTDNMILSRFLGLTTVGIYSNYSLIITSLLGLISKVTSSATSSVGNLLLENDPQKSRSVFEELQLFNTWIIYMSGTAFFHLATPFVSLFFGKDYILHKSTVLLLTIYFYLSGMKKVFGTYKDAAGIQYEDRWIPVIESIVNLILSISLVQCIGINGIFIGTVVSSVIIYCYTFPILIYKNILKGTLRGYLHGIIWQFFGFCLNIILIGGIMALFSVSQTFAAIIFYGVVIFVCTNVFFLAWFAQKKELCHLLKRIQAIAIRRVTRK